MASEVATPPIAGKLALSDVEILRVDCFLRVNRAASALAELTPPSVGLTINTDLSSSHAPGFVPRCIETPPISRKSATIGNVLLLRAEGFLGI